MAPVRTAHSIPDVFLMPSQHGNTLPQALTESARAARMSFFCTGSLVIYPRYHTNNVTDGKTSTGEMCQKGYARMNEFQAHESSYDHSHRMVRPLTIPTRRCPSKRPRSLS